MHSAPMRAGRTRQPVRGGAGMGGAARASADTGGGCASGTDIAELSRGRLVEGVAGVVAEDVLERARPGGQRGLELLRGAGGADGAAVHQGDPVAVLVGLVHV